MHLVFCFIIDQTNNWMMTSNNNVSSAFVHIMNSHSMVSMIQHVTVLSPGRLMGQVLDGEEPRKKRRREKATPRAADAVVTTKKKTPVGKPAAKVANTCHKFNNTGVCDKDGCKFKHVCELCGTADHGSQSGECK
jgi:hypothetical protein